ncbi:hypothetical protein HOP50_04g33360 [Chloropicon primus]|uniref:Uncharacterized protein n=1 Tax=Chloropicon primus TaxID=1764295 RepID=A0A5B8MMC8_9CHLO|nr:hypothetical protein A3770_04p33330 [Chloropicon primus]UPR00027.1 hypothetical protein HOP50_04g33360 [Chloropicon primus]|eukprot:QDZ20815.1 hypothetical protein A3770_04p33330 [Chloropicon primus]
MELVEAKRRRVESPGGEGSGGAPSTSGASASSDFADLVDLCKEKVGEGEGGGSGSTGSFEQRVQGTRDRVVGSLQSALEGLKAAKGEGRREEADRIERDLALMFAHLEAVCKKSGDKLDLLKLSQKEFYRNRNRGPGSWKSLIAYAHRLAFTTFSPPNYVPGDPRWGVIGPFLQPVGNSTGFWHFSPPAPQKWHMDASVLHSEDIQSGGVAKTPAKADDMAVDTPEAERNPPAPKVRDPAAEGEGKVAEEVPKQATVGEAAKERTDKVSEKGAEKVAQEYNPVLSHMVDFVLNPDLEVANHEDFVSDEEMSDSSD